MAKQRLLNCGTCGCPKVDNGKRLICKSCNKLRASKWQAENKERANAKNRRWKERHREEALKRGRYSKVKELYGLTKDEYDLLLAEHNHVCAICGKEEFITLKGTKWNLSIDHCHKTGKIRGLLCAQCNVGIAKFHEDITFLKNAIKYLEERG